MWIELNEWHYRNGEWGTRRLMICEDDISCFMDKVMGECHRACVRVCLKTGRYHDVKETYEEIKKEFKKMYWGEALFSNALSTTSKEADDGK